MRAKRTPATAKPTPAGGSGLGRKVGPLPLSAWVAVAAIGAYLDYRRYESRATSPTAPAPGSRRHAATDAPGPRPAAATATPTPRTAAATGTNGCGSGATAVAPAIAAVHGEQRATAGLARARSELAVTADRLGSLAEGGAVAPSRPSQRAAESTSSLRPTATFGGRLRRALATLGIARATALAALAGTLLLELQAMLNGYGLRVTSDTPTYLALLRDVALHPLAAVSPFLHVAGVQSSHATPDMELLGLLWRQLSPVRSLVAPVQAYHLLAAWGMVVTVLVAHSLFVWVRGFAGSRAGWISIPVLFGLLGPANVIWAGDLSFHGFLYGSYFSQTLAVALLLYALHRVPRAASRPTQLGGVALVALLLLVHPFTGVLFVFLITCQSAAWAWQGRPGWRRAPAITGLAFLLGSAWPAYSLSAAMTVSGQPGVAIIALAVLVPIAASYARVLAPLLRRAGTSLRPPPVRARRLPPLTVLAVTGVILVCLVAGWEQWLATRPITDPLLTTNRIAIYWDDRLIRWPLLFGAGLAGLSGLVQLARARTRLPAFWFLACFGIGLAGSMGIPIPLWNRLLLFCQLPLAAGTAVVLTRARLTARSLVVAGLALSAAVRLLFLFYSPPTVTYYPATWLPAGYSLGQQIPPGGSGVVAADPYASYYVPAATGHPTLLISKSHVGSDAELNAATSGYALLQRLYSGKDWKQATSKMWQQGVRYVIVDHRVTLADPTLEQFSNDPEPLWRTAAQRRQLGSYFERLNLIGHVIADTPQYVIYKLDASKVRWEVGT